MQSKTARFNVLVYQTNAFLKKNGLEYLLRRWPGARPKFAQLKRLIERHLLRKTYAWLQVESGLSKGLWMLLRLPGESRYWHGDHEPTVQNAILAAVRPGDVVYDIGAHVGTIALGTARLVGTQGRVVAFDGDPENIDRLKGNSARNGLEDRLTVLNLAVWSRTANDGISFRRGTTAKSHGGVDADGQHPILAQGETINVPAITLDDFIATIGPPPHLLKIDVEGGEYEVLSGGKDLFATRRPLVIAEVHHQFAADQIAVWLNECRYQAQWNIPKQTFPQCLFAWPAEHDGETWMRKISSLENRQSLPISHG
jgi:FkbM family methyltransferase